VIDMEAFAGYWQGAPQIPKLRVRVILDANALQAELRSGRVDLVPVPTNLTSDALKALDLAPNLKVEQFPGANIVYLGFNTQSAPLDNARVRQAIAYAIDRESIIRDLLLGQAKLAHSILPEESWAYTQGQTYPYDPERAKRLLDEASFRDPDGDGPQMRFTDPIKFQISSGSAATRQFAGVIQNNLKLIGVPVEIETLEFNSLLDQLRKGQYQMTTSRWVGGNQDPVFLKDLFATSEIPTQDRGGRNRSRYSNPEFDRIIEEATNTVDREKARALYVQAQEIISRDLPMMPLWYPANMVVARDSVGNIHVDGSGDWAFIRNLTVAKE
jgi:peptide/nickel transport system substrate-binding protein